MRNRRHFFGSEAKRKASTTPLALKTADRRSKYFYIWGTFMENACRGDCAIDVETATQDASRDTSYLLNLDCKSLLREYC